MTLMNSCKVNASAHAQRGRHAAQAAQARRLTVLLEPGMPNSVLFGLQSCGYPSDKLQLTSVDLNGEAGLAPRVNRKGMHGRGPRAADVIFQPRCLTCMHAQIMRQS
jgi:hypothetical protein